MSVEDDYNEYIAAMESIRYGGYDDDYPADELSELLDDEWLDYNEWLDY